MAFESYGCVSGNVPLPGHSFEETLIGFEGGRHLGTVFLACDWSAICGNEFSEPFDSCREDYHNYSKVVKMFSTSE